MIENQHAETPPMSTTEAAEAAMRGAGLAYVVVDRCPLGTCDVCQPTVAAAA